MSADILEALAARGHDVTVYTYNMEPYRVDSGVKVERLESTRLFTQPKPDIIYTHPGFDKVGPRSYKHYRVPIVGVIHNTLPGTKEEMDWFPKNEQVLFIYNSESTRQALGGTGPVIHSPLDVKKYKTPRKDAKFITIMSLTKDKGVEIFLELAKRLPKYKFLGVAGPYGEQSYFSLPNVDRSQFIVHDDVKSVFARTKILLAPSMAESWGRVAAEAMCSGIPVVASKAPGLVECLDGTGYNLDLDDIDAWESTIRQLVSDKQLYSEQSAMARARAADIQKLASEELDDVINRMEELCSK